MRGPARLQHTSEKESGVVWVGLGELVQGDHLPRERYSAVRAGETEQGGLSEDEAERKVELGEAAAAPSEHLLAAVACGVGLAVSVDGLVAVVVHMLLTSPQMLRLVGWIWWWVLSAKEAMAQPLLEKTKLSGTLTAGGGAATKSASAELRRRCAASMSCASPVPMAEACAVRASSSASVASSKAATRAASSSGIAVK